MKDQNAALKAVASDARAGVRGAVLLSGASGTGKTMAADMLAAELGTTVYRIDLRSLASKYIGETEKNIDKAFGEAERAGAVLLIDEADALLGKRTDVKDAHDRYANLEVGYLLDRIEAYNGLALLATNAGTNIDPVYRGRIRRVIDLVPR
jgi:SpoVK/Ycf46/Vps4 family AAA+-type ATPase